MGTKNPDIKYILTAIGGKCNYKGEAEAILSNVYSAYDNNVNIPKKDKIKLSAEEAKSFFISLALDAPISDDYRDIALCAWGLLDGYQKWQGSNKMTERRKHYLAELERYGLSKPGKPLFSQLTGDEKKIRADALGKKEKDSIFTEISKFFVGLKDVFSYITEASIRYIDKDADPEKEDRIIYPVPTYIKRAKIKENEVQDGTLLETEPGSPLDKEPSPDFDGENNYVATFPFLSDLSSFGPDDKKKVDVEQFDGDASDCRNATGQRRASKKIRRILLIAVKQNIWR